MKKLVLMLIILSVFFPIHAQTDDMLVAILLDHANQNLITISGNGTQSIVPLLIPQTTGTYRFNTTVISNDARYAGFCLGEDNAGSSFTNNYFLNIQDLESGEIIFEKAYEDLFSCIATSFNTDNSQLAVAVIDDFGWTLEVYNLQDSSLVYDLGVREEISNYYADIADIENPNSVYFRITVYYFDDTQIILGSVPFIAMGSPDSVPVFDWNLEDDSLTLREYAGNAFGDNLFASDETVFPTLNPEYDALTNGLFAPTNEINLFNGSEVFPIYRNTEASVTQANFINDGENIMVYRNTPEAQIDILSRDGTIITTEVIPTQASAIATGNHSQAGIILWDEMPDEEIYITHLQMLHIDGTLRDLWVSESFSSPPPIELVWTQPLPSEASYPAFIALDD